MASSRSLLPGRDIASLDPPGAVTPIKQPRNYVHQLRLAGIAMQRAQAEQVAHVDATLRSHRAALDRSAAALEAHTPLMQRMADAAEHDNDLEPASRAAVLIVRCLGMAHDAVLDQRKASAETTNDNLAKAMKSACWDASSRYLADVDPDLADQFGRAFAHDFADDGYDAQVRARLSLLVSLARRIVAVVDDGEGLDALEKTCGRRASGRGVG